VVAKPTAKKKKATSKTKKSKRTKQSPARRTGSRPR
jgi:hypothetical protein